MVIERRLSGVQIGLVACSLSVILFSDERARVQFQITMITIMISDQNCTVRSRVTTIIVQSTPDNSNLQGKWKKVRVIGSSKKIAGSKEKNSFYCTVNILITFNCRNVE